MIKLNIYDALADKSQHNAISVRAGCSFNAQLIINAEQNAVQQIKLYADLALIQKEPVDTDFKAMTHALKAAEPVDAEQYQQIANMAAEHFKGAVYAGTFTLKKQRTEHHVWLCVRGSICTAKVTSMEYGTGQQPVILRPGYPKSFAFADYEAE